MKEYSHTHTHTYISSDSLLLSPVFFLFFVYGRGTPPTATPTVHRALLHTVPLHTTHTHSTPHTLTIRVILRVRNTQFQDERPKTGTRPGPLPGRHVLLSWLACLWHGHLMFDPFNLRLWFLFD